MPRAIVETTVFPSWKRPSVAVETTGFNAKEIDRRDALSSGKTGGTAALRFVVLDVVIDLLADAVEDVSVASFEGGTGDDAAQ